MMSTKAKKPPAIICTAEDTPSDSSPKDIATAVWDVEDILMNSHVTKKGKSLWDQLAKNCKDGVIAHEFVEPVEQCIAKYIAGLTNEDKRLIWEGTETGMMNDRSAECCDIGCIEMDIESELLQEVIDLMGKDDEAEACLARSRELLAQDRRLTPKQKEAQSIR